jgi:GntR family transcriptional regulator, carbon starvation induced regulator
MNDAPDIVKAQPGTNVGSSETLTSRAYANVRRDIIEGRLTPGLKLKIEELRDRYEVGASPIREALSLLSSDGLVDRIEQRGFRVADISHDEFADILNVRCWLEEKALRESIANGDANWEEALVLAAFRLAKEPRSTGTNDNFVANRGWEMHHKAFHTALIAACGSPTLLTYCDQLYDKNVRYRNLAGAISYPARDPSEEHEAILQATLARDPDTAVTHLTNHYRKTGELLSDTLQ